ncbi:MAG TPA: class I SAM-dependent methyltransferase [Oscillospiraceae bacterium]|nr:class I SAM-dependent methyltransferase [Oscillospiraceae bacterium]HPF55784.1 class I SAM-dependent methyltransferase [Clostridiales bacterium]HPK35352.1 class I SAM-dependent methyltransferase [Oscillospiraceae bacterium]HPR74632.1 class I SAM-dependent methyltransferase [Oscillospiraceae bacterium]
MSVELFVNSLLFAAYTGLVASGFDMTDPEDAALQILCENIRKLPIDTQTRAWFANAHGENKINPYYPKGSDISVACFFINPNTFCWDTFEMFLEFINSCGGEERDEQYCQWISQLPEMLARVSSAPRYEDLLEQYNEILQERTPGFNGEREKASRATARFSRLPADIRFAPNLLQSPYCCDFVKKADTTFVISTSPSINGILHEFLHPFVAKYRALIIQLMKDRPEGVADPERMKYYGYMWDDSIESYTHAAEDCIVRGLSLALSDLSQSELESAYRNSTDSGFLLVKPATEYALVHLTDETTLSEMIEAILPNPVVQHYNTLIEENNDPVHDPALLRTYMDKWDGTPFLNALGLSPEKTVLEIGVGTGRLAVKIAPKCKSFCGIDLSPKTIERAKENLAAFQNIVLICGDFLTHTFTEYFDMIYSSLTFMHIEDKSAAIKKAADLLNFGGKLVISIDKNQSDRLECNGRMLKIYPDNPEQLCAFTKAAGLSCCQVIETEFAYIITAIKV